MKLTCKILVQQNFVKNQKTHIKEIGTNLSRKTTCTSITHGKIILLCLHMSNVVRLGVSLSVKNF